MENTKNIIIVVLLLFVAIIGYMFVGQNNQKQTIEQKTQKKKVVDREEVVNDRKTDVETVTDEKTNEVVENKNTTKDSIEKTEKLEEEKIIRGNEKEKNNKVKEVCGRICKNVVKCDSRSIIENCNQENNFCKKTFNSIEELRNNNAEFLYTGKCITNIEKIEKIPTNKGETWVYLIEGLSLMSAYDKSVEKIEFYDKNGKLYKKLYKYSYSLSPNKKYILGELITKTGDSKKDIYKINGDFVWTKTFDKKIVEQWNLCCPACQGTAGDMNIDDDGCLINFEFTDIDFTRAEHDQVPCRNSKKIKYCK